MSSTTLPSGEEPWSKEEYYESRSINKGRSDKDCYYCGNNIPQGMPHDAHKFCVPEYIDIFTHNKLSSNNGDKCKPGQKSCSDLFLKSLK